MSIKIDITSNIANVPVIMDEIKSKIAAGAARTSINRTLTSTRAKTGQELSKRLRLSSTKIKKKVSIEKASGKSLRSLHGVIWFNDDALPMLQFVRGHKNPIKQKGVKIKKRRKLKVEVIRGKKKVLKGAFIQKVKSKQVFKSSGSGFYKQSVPSIGEWISKPFLRDPLQDHMIKTFDKVYANQFEYRMERAARKHNRAKMRKL